MPAARGEEEDDEEEEGPLQTASSAPSSPPLPVAPPPLASIPQRQRLLLPPTPLPARLSPPRRRLALLLLASVVVSVGGGAVGEAAAAPAPAPAPRRGGGGHRQSRQETSSAPSVDVVVARYDEDTSWISRFDGRPGIRFLVYSKGPAEEGGAEASAAAGGPQRPVGGEPPPPPPWREGRRRPEAAAAEQLPNVGRESHTYLHHVVKHYDRLADWTVFTQGAEPTWGYRGGDSSSGHLSDNVTFDDYLQAFRGGKDSFFVVSAACHLPAGLQTTRLGLMSKGLRTASPELCPADGPGGWSPWWFDAKHPHHRRGDDMLEFYARHVGRGAGALRVPPSLTLGFAQGARFAVSRGRIRARPREAYAALLAAVGGERDPIEGYFLEAMWYDLFHPERPQAHHAACDLPALPPPGAHAMTINEMYEATSRRLNEEGVTEDPVSPGVLADVYVGGGGGGDGCGEPDGVYAPCEPGTASPETRTVTFSTALPTSTATTTATEAATITTTTRTTPTTSSPTTTPAPMTPTTSSPDGGSSSSTTPAPTPGPTTAVATPGPTTTTATTATTTTLATATTTTTLTKATATATATATTTSSSSTTTTRREADPTQDVIEGVVRLAVGDAEAFVADPAVRQAAAAAIAALAGVAVEKVEVFLSQARRLMGKDNDGGSAGGESDGRERRHHPQQRPQHRRANSASEVLISYFIQVEPGTGSRVAGDLSSFNADVASDVFRKHDLMVNYDVEVRGITVELSEASAPSGTGGADEVSLSAAGGPLEEEEDTPFLGLGVVAFLSIAILGVMFVAVGAICVLHRLRPRPNPTGDDGKGAGGSVMPTGGDENGDGGAGGLASFFKDIPEARLPGQEDNRPAGAGGASPEFKTAECAEGGAPLLLFGGDGDAASPGAILGRLSRSGSSLPVDGGFSSGRFGGSDDAADLVTTIKISVEDTPKETDRGRCGGGSGCAPRGGGCGMDGLLAPCCSARRRESEEISLSRRVLPIQMPAPEDNPIVV